MEISHASSCLVFVLMLANIASGNWLSKARALRTGQTDRSGQPKSMSTKMQRSSEDVDWSNLFDANLAHMETHLITESDNMLNDLFEGSRTGSSGNEQVRNDVDDLVNQLRGLRRNVDTMSSRYAQFKKRMGSALRERSENQQNTMNFKNFMRDLNEMSGKLASMSGSVGSLTERASEVKRRSPEITRLVDCQAVSSCNDQYGDGEYFIYPTILEGQKVKVYCSGMDGPDPEEYITLPSTNTATYNYSRRYDNDACRFRDRIGDAVSNFRKIRIKIEDMTVQRYDLTFADIIEEAPDAQKAPKFGSGGGCSWDYAWRRFEHCVSPGGFVIDTAGTGLVVDPELRWRSYGYGGRLDTVHRSSDNSHVTAGCDGWCAWCFPVGEMTLVLAPAVGLTGDATEPVCT